MRIGIVSETKHPPDRRVALTPKHLSLLRGQFPQHKFKVQTSSIRAFTDQEYSDEGFIPVDELSDCEILFGVKEVALESLLPGKTYLFFSHTAKEQSQNQNLFQKLSKLGCTLIDYEYLTRNNVRVVAFGYWAGIVGAYNALLGYGKTSGTYSLKSPQNCKDLEEMKLELQKVTFDKPVKLLITGEGRVASGAIEILEATGIKHVSPEYLLTQQINKTVYGQIGPQFYTKHKEGKAFDFRHFVDSPEEYLPAFLPYTKTTDILIACHYWDKRSPVFFTSEEMRDPDFRIRHISDVSCDIPGPLPTSLRASTIDIPFYGIERLNCSEIEAFLPDQITVAAVDNLPSSLPRDASEDFGNALIDSVIPELLSSADSDLIRNATLLSGGKLTKKYAYLANYLGNSGS